MIQSLTVPILFSSDNRERTSVTLRLDWSNRTNEWTKKWWTMFLFRWKPVWDGDSWNQRCTLIVLSGRAYVGKTVIEILFDHIFYLQRVQILWPNYTLYPIQIKGNSGVNARRCRSAKYPKWCDTDHVMMVLDNLLKWTSTVPLTRIVLPLRIDRTNLTGLYVIRQPSYLRRVNVTLIARFDRRNLQSRFKQHRRDLAPCKKSGINLN